MLPNWALPQEIHTLTALDLPNNFRLPQHLLTCEAAPVSAIVVGFSLESYEFTLTPLDANGRLAHQGVGLSTPVAFPYSWFWDSLGICAEYHLHLKTKLVSSQQAHDPAEGRTNDDAEVFHGSCFLRAATATLLSKWFHRTATDCPRQVVFPGVVQSFQSYFAREPGMKPFLFLIFSLCALHTCNGQNLLVRAGDYPTLGNAFEALVTSDSRYVFVTVTNVGGPNYSTPDSEAGKRHGVVSGLQVFRNEAGRLRSIAFIRLGSKGANGATFLPREKTIAVAAGDSGVAFVNVKDAIRGAARPYFHLQGDGAGVFDVVATPDGKYVFSANEYGVLHGQLGNVGVIAVQTDSGGQVTSARTLRQIPTGNKVPSLTISPDGSRLYVVREILPPGKMPLLTGAQNPTLAKHNCVQVIGTPPGPNGLITVIDVKRATSSNFTQPVVIAQTAAGCSPVRAIEASDASALYVSARGDNRILVFSPRLLESEPDHALLREFDSGGVAPVGIRLFSHETMLLVDNSNRFRDSAGSIAVLDISGTAKPPLLQTVPSGQFPRDVSLSRDGKFLYVANYTSRSLEVISVSH